VTYDAASHPTPFPAMAVRPAAALPTLSSNRAGSLTTPAARHRLTSLNLSGGIS
jgi:hypothetical protein